MATTVAPGSARALDPALRQRPPARCRTAWSALAALIAGLAGSGQAAAAECSEEVAAAAAPANTTITSVTAVPADAELPDYCRVEGFVDTEITFELRLPDPWNEKFLFLGSGGLAGVDPAEQFGGAAGNLQDGYAVVASDTGHRGKITGDLTSPVYDASWAYANTERQINWAHRSLHVVTEAAKAIIEAHYGAPSRFSYFSGCSGGGRQAAMVAQRYPEDFDGVVAGAPWLRVTNQVMAWTSIVQTLTEAPVPPEKLPLIADAVMTACDAKDGLEDGQVTDPRRCEFDPSVLACKGEDGSDCLTEDELDSVLTIYDGPTTSDGEKLFPGLVPGGEDLLWPNAIVHTETGGPGQLLGFLPDEFLRYFVFGPDYDLLTFDFDQDPWLLEPAADLFNVKPDLSAFRAASGKMLIWHGWNDPRLSPWDSIRYRHDVIRELRRTPRVVGDFFRLFMAPGVGHCGSGDAPNQLDPLAALEDWVERGIAPERIVASQVDDAGETVRTRPLCVYPQVAEYTGEGSIDDADSFVCVREGREGMPDWGRDGRDKRWRHDHGKERNRHPRI
jgi:pimeloyl-ACP methyl ester carboxylesterase